MSVIIKESECQRERERASEHRSERERVSERESERGLGVHTGRRSVMNITREPEPLYTRH